MTVASLVGWVERRDGWRVVIEPRRPGDLGGVSVPDRWMAATPEKVDEHYARECERIAVEARRHVDDHAGVRVVYDRVRLCRDCGARWTEGDAAYNGGCCDADEARQPGGAS